MRRPTARLLGIVRARVPDEHARWIRRRGRRLVAPARLGVFRRGAPLSDSWGYDRGTPVDRYFIHRFLERNRRAITGRVLEVQDDRYTRRFGHDVERSDVLDIDPANPRATVVGDLAAPESFEPDRFDCFVLTQTLQFVYDVEAAVRSVHRVLRPGGVVLATAPVASRVSEGRVDREYWRFTAASMERLFAAEFDPANVEVATYGNLLALVAFLGGFSAEELPRRRLDRDDDHFPLVVSVRAVK